ncbi:MAG: RDD family protein [Chloroflexota bacterium]
MESYSDKLSIDTPENILLDAEIAGFGSRFVAALIDYTIIFALLFVITVLFSLAQPPNRNTAFQGSSVSPVYYVAIFLITWSYHLIFELVWNGQTPGKRRAGIRVIQANGLPVTVSAILIRNIVRLFDFLPAGYGVGLIMLFATKRTQRLGDLAARTVVIREQREVTLQTIKEDMRIEYHYIKTIEPLPYQIQVDRLTQEDRRRVVDFLRRRKAMSDVSSVADMLARQISQKMEVEGLSVKGGRVSEVFLEQVARAFELADQMDRREG